MHAIRQLGQSVEGLETVDTAAEFVRHLLADQRALLVFDNVTASAELKYFMRFKELPQAAVLLISHSEELKSELDAKRLDLSPLKAQQAVQLLRALTGVTAAKYRSPFERVAALLYCIPGLICPIAVQIKTERSRWN